MIKKKIKAISDLHGSLPDPESIGDCDVLLIAGDVCPDHPIGKHERYSLGDNGALYQLEWLADDFARWLKRINNGEGNRPRVGDPVDHIRPRQIFGIAGNHDFVFERKPNQVADLALPWTYLQDSAGEIVNYPWYEPNLKVWGSPWVPGLSRWAFSSGSDDGKMADRMREIPDDTDILLIHGPPYGCADFVAPQFGSQHVGNTYLSARLLEIKRKRGKTPIVVCGHIHEQYGIHTERESGASVYNVAHLDERYSANTRPPITIQEFLYND